MIPYGRQSIDEDDIDAVAEVLRSDFLTTGPKVAEFEKALCEVTGAQYAVACSNGTTALHLASLALDIGEGDCVIVPSVTFLATANAPHSTGAEIVFADVDPETGLIGAQHLEEALERSDKTPKAVFPVHLTGQCVDLGALSAVCKNRNIKIIADSCHGLGGRSHGNLVGSCVHEDMATFSFHPVKTIAMGEGGAVTTNDAEQAERMRRLRHHGMQPTPEQGPWCYDMPELGYNHRLTDMQCALGISQLKKLPKFVKRRQELVALYDEALAGLGDVILPPHKVGDPSETSWHLYAARIDFEKAGVTRANVMNALKEQGVGTQVHYIPVHTQPYYKKRYGEIELPGAQAYYAKTLSLPLYPSMRDEDVVYVVDKIKSILGV